METPDRLRRTDSTRAEAQDRCIQKLSGEFAAQEAFTRRRLDRLESQQASIAENAAGNKTKLLSLETEVGILFDKVAGPAKGWEDRPAELGWYWFRNGRIKDVRHVSMHELAYWGGRPVFGQWYGPIPEPD